MGYTPFSHGAAKLPNEELALYPKLHPWRAYPPSGLHAPEALFPVLEQAPVAWNPSAGQALTPKAWSRAEASFLMLGDR
jgi:hypothetical protein